MRELVVEIASWSESRFNAQSAFFDISKGSSKGGRSIGRTARSDDSTAAARRVKRSRRDTLYRCYRSRPTAGLRHYFLKELGRRNGQKPCTSRGSSNAALRRIQYSIGIP